MWYHRRIYGWHGWQVGYAGIVLNNVFFGGSTSREAIKLDSNKKINKIVG
jgi:hypothetical protein